MRRGNHTKLKDHETMEHVDEFLKSTNITESHSPKQTQKEQLELKKIREQEQAKLGAKLYYKKLREKKKKKKINQSKVSKLRVFQGDKALHEACHYGTLEEIEETLKKHHEKINMITEYQLTKNGSEQMAPIHIAAYLCNIPAVELLLQAGAEVDKIDSDGTSALHVASCLGSTQLVKLLIKYKADVNINDFKNNEHGATPLHWAAIMGHAKVVELLLEAGAKELKNNIGMTALHFSSSVGRQHRNDVLKYLYQPKVLSISRPNQGCYTDIIKLLINHGFNPNAEDSSGITPLHMAASANQLDRIQTLLDLGADPTKTSNIPVTQSDGNVVVQPLAPHNLAELKNFHEAAAILKK